MRNINYNVKQVNIFNSVSKLLVDKMLDKGILEIATDENDNNYYRLKDPSGEGYVENCPLHVPVAYAEAPKSGESKRSKNKNPEEKYSVLAECMHKGFVANKVLQLSLGILRDSLGVGFWKENQVITVFELNQNGSRRKAWADANKIKLHAERAAKLYPYTMFLTLTQRVEPGKTDIIGQYKDFGKEQSKFLDKLQKQYHCQYEAVSEATAKGYRHAHIVLHFKKLPDVAKVVKGKSGIAVYGGKFREWIKSAWTLGTSKLELAGNRNPITYLTKYITKFAYSDMSKLADTEHELTKEERKNIQTLLFPILSRTRRYNLSQLDDEEVSKTDKIILTSRKLKPVEKPLHMGIARPARSLDNHSINFELPCSSFFRISSYSRFKSASKCEIEDFDKLTQKVKEQLYDSATPVKCKSCILTHWLNEMRYGNDEWFHKHAESTIADARKELFKMFGSNEEPVPANIGEEMSSDFWRFTEDERAERKELVKKYDERALPFVLPKGKMNLTFYKKALTPGVGITFKNISWIWDESKRDYVDYWSGNFTQRIDRYLLKPTYRFFDENKVIANMTMYQNKMERFSDDENQIDKNYYERYLDVGKEKLTDRF